MFSFLCHRGVGGVGDVSGNNHHITVYYTDSLLKFDKVYFNLADYVYYFYYYYYYYYIIIIIIIVVISK